MNEIQGGNLKSCSDDLILYYLLNLFCFDHGSVMRGHFLYYLICPLVYITLPNIKKFDSFLQQSFMKNEGSHSLLLSSSSQTNIRTKVNSDTTPLWGVALVGGL